MAGRTQTIAPELVRLQGSVVIRSRAGDGTSQPHLDIVEMWGWPI
jgi:hypothetical protein